MSVYLGSQIENVFEQISSGKLTESLSAGMMDLGINTLPVIKIPAASSGVLSSFARFASRKG